MIFNEHRANLKCLKHVSNLSKLISHLAVRRIDTIDAGIYLLEPKPFYIGKWASPAETCWKEWSHCCCCCSMQHEEIRNLSNIWHLNSQSIDSFWLMDTILHMFKFSWCLFSFPMFSQLVSIVFVHQANPVFKGGNRWSFWSLQSMNESQSRPKGIVDWHVDSNTRTWSKCRSEMVSKPAIDWLGDPLDVY